MHRKMFPESKRFQYFRYGTTTIIILFYLSYLIYVLVQVANDMPLVQTSYEYVDKLGIPDIEVCGMWSDVEISRCVFTWNDWNTTTFDGCKEFLYQYRTKDNSFCYLYASNDTYFYGNTESKKLKGPWVRNIDFYFDIKNITEITSHYISVGTIAITLMDRDFNPLWGANATLPSDVRIKQEFQLTNGFAGIQNMTTLTFFKKTIFRSILPYDISAILGGNPNYHNTSYLTIAPKNFPMHPNDNFTDTGHFNIAPGSFILEVKSEKRSHTIIGVLGLAGGAFGVTGGIYVILFGHRRNDPWGIMHRLMKFEIGNANLQNSSNLPFVSKIDPENKNIPAEQRIEQLEARVLNLETILNDYVFNPSIIKQMIKRQNDEET